MAVLKRQQIVKIQWGNILKTIVKYAALLIFCKRQSHSYAPYSNYNVSAAVLMSTGKIYCGVNIENAAYPAGICAEDNAINMAIADNKDSYIVAIAIIGGPNYTVRDYCAPCGISRQVIREFYKPGVTRVIFAKTTEDYKDMSLDELLPCSFGPEALEK